MDDAEHLMPAYLRFVRGVIDSNDLPLNVSREILQESKDVEAIRTGSVRRVLSLLEDLAEKQQEKYATFWKEFGRVLQGGRGRGLAPTASASRSSLRFASTHADSEEQNVGARGLRLAHEGRAGEDLLRDGGDLQRGARRARTWRSSARRASRCCCCPTGWTSGSCRT